MQDFRITSNQILVVEVVRNGFVQEVIWTWIFCEYTPIILKVHTVSWITLFITMLKSSHHFWDAKRKLEKLMSQSWDSNVGLQLSQGILSQRTFGLRVKTGLKLKKSKYFCYGEKGIPCLEFNQGLVQIYPIIYSFLSQKDS